MRGLTSLFGMGRGEHPRQNHHKTFGVFKKLNRFKMFKRLKPVELNELMETIEHTIIRLTYWNKL